MHLAFCRARADGAPADEIADVLRRDHVQELAAGGHAQAVDVDEQLPRHPQAFINAVSLVQIGVVDEALPAYGGAWLFEVHAHDDLQRVLVLLPGCLQAARVLQCGGRIVDRARTDHDEEPIVLARHDVVNVLASLCDQRLDRRAANREKADQVLGRRQHGDVLDTFVVGLAGFVDAAVPGIAGRGGRVRHGACASS